MDDSEITNGTGPRAVAPPASHPDVHEPTGAGGTATLHPRNSP